MDNGQWVQVDSWQLTVESFRIENWQLKIENYLIVGFALLNLQIPICRFVSDDPTGLRGETALSSPVGILREIYKQSNLFVGNDPVSFREGNNIRWYKFQKKYPKFPILTTIIELFLTQLMHTGYDTATERHRVVPYEHPWGCIRCNEICTGDDGAIYPLRPAGTSPKRRGKGPVQISNSSTNWNW